MTDVFKKIRKAFDNLEKRIFVSEADFQHALAMKLERYFKGRVRLEYPIIRPKRVQTTKGKYPAKSEAPAISTPECSISDSAAD